MKRHFLIVLFLILVINCSAQVLQDGYTDKLSYRAGEVVTFSINTAANCGGCTLDLRLEDISGNVVYTLPDPIDVPSGQAITNTTNYWEAGYGYTPSQTTWTVPISGDVQPGYYLIDDDNNPNVGQKIPIIIKGDNGTGINGSTIVIVCPTNTVNAYTDYTHHSLYYGGDHTVSFHRPQDYWDFTNFADGFLYFMSLSGYRLNFISDQDMDDWDEIKNAKLIIIPGHSEYWTRQARLNLDRFIDGDQANSIHGKSALILSGNSIWCQVEYEDASYQPSPSQITCKRGSNWYGGTCPMDDNSDPLIKTYPWMSPDLKYSVLGSIGCDWLRGGQIPTINNTTGYKVLIPNSPLFNTISFTNNILTINTSGQEYDGTLVKTDGDGNTLRDVNNNDPTLDIHALGFYRAEMVGYIYYNPDPHNPIPNTNPTRYQFYDLNPNNLNQYHCAPILIFKKTCNSGTVINVSSTAWCIYDSYWSGYRYQITDNMINELVGDAVSTLNGSHVFTTSVPMFGIKSAYSNVSYSVCTSNSSIHFTPCGVYLNDAYKVDHGFTSNHVHSSSPQYNDEFNFITSASVDASCSTYQALRIAHEGGDDKPATLAIKPTSAVSLFPNPNSGTFTININNKGNGKYSLLVFDISGRIIEQKQDLVNGNNTIDESKLEQGLYLYKVYSATTLIGNGKISIIKTN